MSKVIKYLRPEMSEKFYKTLPNERDQLIFKLMGKMGLRVGEVVGETLDYWTYKGEVVKRKDYPADLVAIEPNKEVNNYIHVITVLPGVRLEHVDWVEHNLLVHGKGDKERIVPFNKDVWTTMMKFIGATTMSRDELMQLNGQLITKYNDLPITTQQVRKLCTKYAGIAGLNVLEIHPHMFRHTFAVNYLLNGGMIRPLQIVMGHSSLAVTEKYLQLIEGDIKDDWNKVEITEEMKRDPTKFKRELAESMIRAVMDKMG